MRKGGDPHQSPVGSEGLGAHPTTQSQANQAKQGLQTQVLSGARQVRRERTESWRSQALWQWVASAQCHLLLIGGNAANVPTCGDNPSIWTCCGPLGFQSKMTNSKLGLFFFFSFLTQKKSKKSCPKTVRSPVSCLPECEEQLNMKTRVFKSRPLFMTLGNILSFSEP